MFYINGSNVSLTRGDSCYIRVDVMGYELQDGDTLTLSIKTDTDATTPYLVNKTITINHTDPVFEFVPTDTKTLEYGTYKYDVQLDTIDGGRYTIVPPSDFVIMEEVTHNA